MTTRFLFGRRGLLVEGPPPVPPRREEPVAVEAVDVRDERTTEELFAAVHEALKDGGRATEAERGGIFRARNIAPDGSFDYYEHHYMQGCGCRVIDSLIVQWCPAHDAYYRRVCSGGNYRPADYEQRRARWAGVVER